MILKKWAVTVVLAASAVMTSQQIQAGTIGIFQRESSAGNVLFAGSGGAVQQHNVNDSVATLTGAFGFSDSQSVAVATSDQYSLGAADAFGSISVADNVTQSSPGTIVLTASRAASSTANHIDGSGTGQSSQDQVFRVRFTTGADPVNFVLTGDFDPGISTGIIGEAGFISLHRPFTAHKAFSTNVAMARINEIGTIPANQTWEFQVRMNDKISGTANHVTSATDASSLNISITLQSVPEPASASLFAGASLFLINRKRRR